MPWESVMSFNIRLYLSLQDWLLEDRHKVDNLIAIT
jgi:hypothetical protein